MDDFELPNEALEDEGTEVYRDKRVALLISILAVLLALTEILGQQAQVTAVQKSIEASNQWAFFQGKAERETTYSLAVDVLEAVRPSLSMNAQHDAQQNLEKWRAAAAKLHDDPEKQAGTIQLYKRAKTAEAERDTADEKHNRYELAIAALHIGIVLASASIITGMSVLITASMSLGGAALLLMLGGLIV